MHKDRIAEWILEQVTTRERASSTVGDLMESAATRGTAWFWSNVLRTAGSQVWRGMTADPVFMIGLAFRGLLLNLALSLLCLAGFLFIYGLAYSVLAVDLRKGWIVLGLGLGAVVLAQFQSGRWAGRRAPGRELSSGLALILLSTILAGPIQVGLALATGDSSRLPGLILMLLASIPCQGAYLAGAAWARRRVRSA
jgi:hypothetical protein